MTAEAELLRHTEDPVTSNHGECHDHHKKPKPQRPLATPTLGLHRGCLLRALRFGRQHATSHLPSVPGRVRQLPENRVRPDIWNWPLTQRPKSHCSRGKVWSLAVGP